MRSNTQEWMDEEVLEGIRIRNKLLSKIKRTTNQTDHVNFRKARNNIISLTKKEKKNRVVSKLNENIGKPRELWKNLKSLGVPSKQDKPLKICLKWTGSTDKNKFIHRYQSGFRPYQSTQPTHVYHI